MMTVHSNTPIVCGKEKSRTSAFWIGKGCWKTRHSYYSAKSAIAGRLTYLLNNQGIVTEVIFVSTNQRKHGRIRNANQDGAHDEGDDDVRQRGEQAEAGFRILGLAFGSVLRLLFHWIDGLGLRPRGFFLRAQEAGEPVV